MIDYEKIIDKYYATQSRLRTILTVHSRLVADKALECAKRRALKIDAQFVEEAAMLHDIGIYLCDARDICCFGKEPYIRHGILGGKILRDEGLMQHALVCERHTGAGLTIEDIVRQNLPLPKVDMTPQTIEEKLICYADKFYSKSGDIEKEKTIDRVINSMSRHGEDSLRRFLSMHEQFG